MFKFKKKLTLEGQRIEFSYNSLLGEVIITDCGETKDDALVQPLHSAASIIPPTRTIVKRFVWLPYQTIHFQVKADSDNNQKAAPQADLEADENVRKDHARYTLKVMLFPISKMKLVMGESVICADLFPKLKRYTVVNFTLSSIKKLALTLGLVFG